MIEHTDAGKQGPVAAPSIIFGTIVATIHGPAGGPWEAVHPAPPPANGNGAALIPDDIPDLSLGEDWDDDGRSRDYVEPDPISAEAYFDLTDEEKREVAQDARGLPYGYWSWSKEAWNRYGRENPRTPNAGPPRERLEVNSEGFARNRTQQGEQEPPAIITRRASDITPEPISWLWKYWIARGKLHIIGGVPETGKTTIALAYAAIVSSGATWPDGTRAAVGNVLIWTSEDDPADTLVPRLIRMDADLSRIHFIEEAIPPSAKSRPFNPATDMLALVAKAEAIGDVVLLILDPVVAAMPMTRNSHNNAEARNGMQPVVDFAKASDIAVIGIGHLTKGTAGKDPLERLNGSGAFGALPRLVMGAAKNEANAGEDKPERVMVRIKSNIGPSGGGFGYHIDMAPLLEQPDIEATRIVWELPLEGTARELLNAAEGLDEDDNTSKIAEAMVFLKTALGNGERLQREIMAEAKGKGIAEKTLRRAAKGTVGKRKAALGWYWWNMP